MPHRAPQSRSNRPRILFVVTAAITLRFFDGTREELRARGYDVVLVSSPGERLEAARDAGFEAHAVAMAREMAPLRDLRSLLQLVRLFRRLRPQMVVAGTPKAGLLGTLAARLTGVPQIVLQMHGLRSETFTGWKRRLIAGTERISARLAHVTVCVSSSLCRRARQRGVLRADQGTVVGHGGANGILMEEFAPSAERHRAARKLRAQLGWGPQHRVLGYVGRLVSDKGAAELFTAFASLSRRDEWLRLLLIGGYEEGDPLPAPLREQLGEPPGGEDSGLGGTGGPVVCGDGRLRPSHLSRGPAHGSAGGRGRRVAHRRLPRYRGGGRYLGRQDGAAGGERQCETA